ncbi:MAG: polysaccharide deacetylase family protein [Brevinematales bacterium]|nr:polysaccharide deacetylase family protein [Brevinematales bacterium]
MRIELIVINLILKVSLVVFAFSSSYANSIVLCYHKIGYSMKDIYSVLPEMLELQIHEANKMNFKLVGLDYFTNTMATSEYTISITFDDGWKLPQRTIEFLKSKNTRTTFFIYPKVIGGKDFFSWDEIKGLSSSGFIIGSHSYSHLFLKDLPSDILYQEVVYSKKYIEDKVGIEVFAFAYPFGVGDSSAYKLASKTYKVSFTVDDSPIVGSKSKYYKLPRYIIFNHTTLGQFREFLDSVYGNSNLDYRVYHVKSEVKGLKAKLYHFPVEYPEFSVLVVPSMYVGPSWFKPMIDRLREYNVDVWVFYSEVYSFPFYKYEVYYDLIKDITLQGVSKSLESVLNILPSRNVIIITWGDGFDLLFYCFNRMPLKKILKILAINPSILESKTLMDLESNIKLYNSLISRGKYDFNNVSEGVKVSVLLNLAYISPYSKTPFSKEFGDKVNIKVFIDYVGANINLKFSHLEEEKVRDIIYKIQWSPFLVFSFIQPISYFLGLNQFWKSILKEGRRINYDQKILVMYNDNFEYNVRVITNVVPSIVEKFNLSTVEMFLSGDVFLKILDFIKN